MFAELAGPGTVTCQYNDQPEVIPAAPLSAWTIKTGGFSHPATSIIALAGSIDVAFGPPGPPAVGEFVTYNPPPDSVRSLATGVPAQVQIDFPLE